MNPDYDSYSFMIRNSAFHLDITAVWKILQQRNHSLFFFFFFSDKFCCRKLLLKITHTYAHMDRWEKFPVKRMACHRWQAVVRTWHIEWMSFFFTLTHQKWRKKNRQKCTLRFWIACQHRTDEKWHWNVEGHNSPLVMNVDRPTKWSSLFGRRTQCFWHSSVSRLPSDCVYE